MGCAIICIFSGIRCRQRYGKNKRQGLKQQLRTMAWNMRYWEAEEEVGVSLGRFVVWRENENVYWSFTGYLARIRRIYLTPLMNHRLLLGQLLKIPHIEKFMKWEDEIHKNYCSLAFPIYVHVCMGAHMHVWWCLHVHVHIYICLLCVICVYVYYRTLHPLYYILYVTPQHLMICPSCPC